MAAEPEGLGERHLLNHAFQRLGHDIGWAFRVSFNETSGRRHDIPSHRKRTDDGLYRSRRPKGMPDGALHRGDGDAGSQIIVFAQDEEALDSVLSLAGVPVP